MKNLVFVCLLFVSVMSWAQFPGENVTLFEGATVTPKQLSESFQRFGYDNFYSALKEDSKDVDRLKEVYKPGVRKYDLLYGKKFTVASYYPFKDYYILVLTNEELGTVYYKYSPKYESSFELDFIDVPNLPADFYCQYITYQEFPKHQAVDYSTEQQDRMYFSRTETKKYGTMYTVNLNQATQELEVNKKGAWLLLDDGTKIEHTTCPIEVKVNSAAEYVYYTYFELTEAQMKKISEHPIVQTSVYTFTHTVAQGGKISKMVACLLKK